MMCIFQLKFPPFSVSNFEIKFCYEMSKEIKTDGFSSNTQINYMIFFHIKYSLKLLWIGYFKVFLSEFRFPCNTTQKSA